MESDRRAVAAIGKNLEKTQLTGPAATVQEIDVFRFIDRFAAPASYEIILADPPYSKANGERDFAPELLCAPMLRTRARARRYLRPRAPPGRETHARQRVGMLPAETLRRDRGRLPARSACLIATMAAFASARRSPPTCAARFLYNLFFPLVFLALLPGFLLRMFRRGGYREKFRQRLGRYTAAERQAFHPRRVDMAPLDQRR